MNDYALFFHIGLVTLEHLVLWLENSTSVNLSKADSTFGIRLSWMAMQERLLFSCFFSHVFEIAQLDFTRKDVTVNGVIRTCPELTGYLLIFLWLRHVIFLCYSHVFENLGERSIPWLHRFKLPNLPGNLSPRVEEAGVYVKRVNMERENMWR